MQLKEMVASSDNIVFFGGAGVSTESGIPDFRSVLRFQLGVLFFEQGIQLLLVFQQGSIQVRHCGRFGLWRFAFRLSGAAKARLSPCAEHTVHKVFPIVGICHGLPSVFVVFFQYSVPGQVLQFPLEKSTPVVYTYCMENKKKE